MPKRLNGFALVEVSIALLILGMITSITMTQMVTLTKLRKEQVTRDNIEFILKALGAYYLNKNGQLPNPTRIMEEGFGLVPWQTMGIMERYSKDGYGRPLLYKHLPALPISQRTTMVHGGFAIKNDHMLLEIKTVDGKHRYWYTEKVFTQVYCNGKSYTPSITKTSSIGAKF